MYCALYHFISSSYATYPGVISDYMVFGFNKDIRIRIRIRIHPLLVWHIICHTHVLLCLGD